MREPHFINGRILLRDGGGVQRYAREVSEHLERAQVLQPRSAKFPWSGRFWEQLQLPRQAAEGVLLNMAHGGPRRHPRQVNVVHDLIALSDPSGVHPAYAALLRRQLPHYVSSANQLVTVSKAVACQVADNFGVPLGSIHIVPPGISPVFATSGRTDAHTRLGLDPSRLVVAALLDPTPRKNSDVVASLLRELQLQDPTLQVVVAGRAQPASFARANGSPATYDRSTFTDLGAPSDVTLATMFQAADVVVSLTASEGFGLPAVEAAACGAAVVTTPVPSVAEHVADGVVTVQAPEGALDAVTGLLANSHRRRELTDIASESLGDLQWAKTAASLEALMNQAG